jgi:hypothetical protein
MPWVVGTTSAPAVSKPCGSWVVAVDGNEEMLLAAAVGHRPHHPPSTGRRWPGLLLVVAAEKIFSKKLPTSVDDPRFRGWLSVASDPILV